MPDDSNPLRDTELLSAILDLLIPPRPDGRLPGAGALGLAEKVGAALETDPRSGPLVQAGLLALQAAVADRGDAGLGADDRLGLLRAIADDHPALIPGLQFHLQLAYYQDPRVLAALGRPARPPFPEGYAIEETDPELVALLESRRQQAPDG